MNDETLMPFGKYEGEKLANIPASYLIWLGSQIEAKNEYRRSVDEKHLLAYVNENKDVLEKENKR